MSCGEVNPRAQRWLRYLLGGGVNTVITYGIYLALNLVLGYQWAYLFAYALGVVFSYCFNAVLVFRVPLSWKGFFSYPLVYVIQYGSSALLLGVLVEFANMSEKFVPLLVSVCMVPLSYTISKLILVWSNNSKMATERRVEQGDR